MNFIEKLIELEKHHYRQGRKLADKLGISYTYLSSIINGKREAGRQTEIIVDLLYAQLITSKMVFSVETSGKLIALMLERKIKAPNEMMSALIDDAYAKEFGDKPAGQLNRLPEYSPKPTTVLPSDKIDELANDAVRGIKSLPHAPVSAPKKPVKK